MSKCLVFCSGLKTSYLVGIVLWNCHHHHQVRLVGNTILLKIAVYAYRPTSDEFSQLSAPFSLPPPPHTYDYISLFQHSSSLQYALFWCRYAKYVFWNIFQPASVYLWLAWYDAAGLHCSHLELQLVTDLFGRCLVLHNYFIVFYQ